MYAELSLDHQLLKDVIEKSCNAAIQRELGDYLKQAHGASTRRACRIAGISDSVPDTARDAPVVRALQAAVERYAAYGFSKLFKILRRRGHSAFTGCTCPEPEQTTAWQEAASESQFRALGRANYGQPLLVHRLYKRQPVCGRRCRTFNVVDDFNRGILVSVIDLNLPGRHGKTAPP